MSSVQDNKEMYQILNRALPNIATYMKVILKREKLSDEAETMRARYEGLISSLEAGSSPSLRPVSIVCDDDSGYFSGNRQRVSELLDAPKGVPGINHSGYLLRRDDKYRWHRSWCKADSKEMKFFIYEDLNEEILIRSFSLDGVTTRFGPHPVPDSDKENSFAICGIGIAIEPLPVTSATSEPNDPNGLVSPAPPTSSSSGQADEAYFAAYSEGDYKQWKEVLHMLTSSRESSRISLSFLDSAPWMNTTSHDSTSTSSSSFGSNRESVISTTSSLLNNRMSTRLEESKPESALADDSKRLSAAKQQQPLPSPPHIMPENVPLPEDNDDNASEGTIYESIDNLVSQFDDAMRATAAAMGQIGESMKAGGKKRKKKLLSRQTSFLTKTKGHKSNFLSEKKSELERGDKYTGYLFKKTSSGSWKKRWCSLKGCVFGYYKSMEDPRGREYVVLDAEVNRINDPKRSFAFSLTCKGVEEMYYAAEDDDLYEAWIARLSTASRSHGEYSDAWTNWQSEENLASTPGQVGEGIYSVPRSLPLDQLVPRPATTMTPEMAIETGIYSVPKFLLEQPSPAADGASNGTAPAFNAADIYDVPRMSISPDEEGIYDDPYDILDMEIYDYPPDVSELDKYLEDSGLDTTEHSTRTSTITVTTEATDRTSSTISEDSWKTMSLPPLPPGARPYSMISSDEYQSNRNSVISVESGTGSTFPRNQPPPPPLDLQSIFERPSETMLLDHTPDYPDTSSLEFGQCIIRGHLYKKERLTWTKLYSIIRNNFLECHKSHGGGYMPALKLFLPGSEIKPGGGDSKRRNALQVKHPRRDGVLVFATETAEEYPQWVKAFRSGAAIEVQPVRNVEEMRITDLEMQRRWTADKDTFNDPEGWNGTLPRRKTYSNDGKTEDYASDTLKRRRRFTLGKLGKKKDKKSTHQTISTPDLKQMKRLPPVPTENFTHDRRSVSCEDLPTEPAANVVESHQVTGPDGQLKFQGCLSVHRYAAKTNFINYWCVFDGSTVNCYINQYDLTLTMSVSLPGSQIAEASNEAGRPHSFKVWHMETGQCIFFSAESAHEYNKWFMVLTQNAEQIQTAQQAGAKAVFFVVPGTELKVKSFHIRQRSNSLPTSPVDEGAGGDNGSVASNNTGHGSSDTPVSTFYRGNLKKASNSHSGKWKDRYCVVKDGQLSLYHHQGEKSAITSIDLSGCSIELVTVPRSSTHKLVFKLNLASGDKTHTFAAPSESEMYAWISALRDSSYEGQSRSQTELSTGGSANSSPALSGKSSLRKRGSKSKLADNDLVSYVSAATLTNPDISGFADVQVSPDSWTRFWCVVHSDCLYIYQTAQSQATVKTVVLPGYDIHVADPLTYKRQYAILLSHSGVAPVCLAVNDELELNQWLAVLDKGARAEGLNSKQPVNQEQTKVANGKSSSRSSGAKKKGPMKADHTISARKDGGSAASSPASSNKTPEAHQDSVIRRYEKRIRKTHRVANQTEHKLKEQQTSLLHFKKELSRHVVKLQEMASSGDASAQKRLENVRKKIQQVDKIVPYLGKYITVNRQAELQTVAVLKESCTMEIQKMARSPTKGRDQTDSDKPVEENPYASLTEILPQVEQAKAKSNYAQLDFARIPTPGGSVRPPSVNYAEVKIGAGGKGVIINGGVPTQASQLAEIESNVPTESAGDEPENLSAAQDTTLTPDNAPSMMSTPGRLETVQEVTSPPPLSPIHPPPAKVPQPPAEKQVPTEQVQELPPSDEMPADDVPTVPEPPAVPQPPAEQQPPTVPEPPTEQQPPTVPEPPAVPQPPAEQQPPTVPQRSSSLEPPIEVSPSHPSRPSPPKVARKPVKTSTPIRRSASPPLNGHNRDSVASDTSEQGGSERDHTSPARQDASTILSGAPSVIDRIKALKQQNS